MRLSSTQMTRLEELGVSLVYLFGSYAEGVVSPSSDLDLGVVFTVVPQDHVQAYQALYDLFTDAFPHRQLDIVLLQQASLELRGDAIRHGTVLYESSLEARAVFEERTMLACADFAPLQREIDRAIVART